jgi:VanZ family protein
MSVRRFAAQAWALLALFVIYASGGTWTREGPGIWAPLYLEWSDLAQNVLVYLPFGVLGVLTLRGRRQSALAAALEVAVLAFLFSLFVEVIQLYTVERIASLTDVLAATIGATTGGLVAEPAVQAADRALGAVQPSGVFQSPDAPVLFALLLAVIVVAWWPFDPTLDVSSLATRVRTVRNDPWQFDAASAITQAMCYLCLSLAIAVSAYRLSTVAAMLAGAAAAGVIAMVVGAGQFAMGSQPIGLADFGAQIAGAMSGSALFALGRIPR